MGVIGKHAPPEEADSDEAYRTYRLVILRRRCAIRLLICRPKIGHVVKNFAMTASSSASELPSSSSVACHDGVLVTVGAQD
jgi:hypothetical protein